MKKLLRLVHKRPSDHRETTSEDDQNDQSSLPRRHRSSPELEIFARNPVRYGLRAVPLLPCKPATDTTLYEVDVVAVHGLGGDSYKTWTYTKGNGRDDDVFWLSQLLPHDLPGARVFSFGYESGPTFSRSVASVKDSAKQLLQNLLTITNTDRRRPIIFVCHSLGGIVVKQAIITAHEQDRYSAVLRASHAIMFMGTPHRGSDIAAAVKPLSKIANFWLGISGTSAFTGSMRTDLIDLLTRESVALGNINESFIPRTQNLVIISCSETQRPKGLQQLVVSQPSALLRIPQEEDIPLSADHMSMCRFSSLDDPNYKHVCGALIRASQKLHLPASRPEKHFVVDPSNRSLTKSELKYVIRFDTAYRANIDDRVDGTCLWLLRSPQYQSWCQDESSSVLWVTGEAGCGKTVMTAFLFENLEKAKIGSQMSQHGDIVCCFFCARDVETQKDARSILRGLLKQILLSRKDVIHQIRASFDSAKQEFDQSFESLWKVFKFTIEIVPFRCLYIVIDALDECEQRSKEKFLHSIVRILMERRQADAAPVKHLKFIISGQPHVMTTWRAAAVSLDHYRLQIEQWPEGMIEDIVLFINSKVDELVANLICGASAGEKLKKALYPLAENSFLWVSIILNHIKASLDYRDENVIQMLTDVPQSLKEAFTKYLPLVEAHNLPIVKRYIQLLVACAKPLTLREMHIFATVQGHRAGSPITDEKDLVIKNSLQRALGPLLRLSEGRVQFVHSTVKDYFLDLNANSAHHLASSHGTNLESAHLSLATSCMRYLLLDEYSIDLFDPMKIEPDTSLESPTSTTKGESPNDDIWNFDSFSIHDVNFLKDENDLHEDICAELRRRYEAYDYAACHWTYHYAMCEEHAPDAIFQQAIALSSPGSAQSANWYRYMANQSRSTMPQLTEVDNITVAALFNHCRTLRTLLLNTREVSPRTLQKALFGAASRGHAAAVQVLLEHDPGCIVPEQGPTPLSVAVQGGFQDVCATILKFSDADPNYCSRESRPPLVLAAAYNHLEILRQLLAHARTRVDQTDLSGYTPLLEASRSGSVECLQELIGTGRSDVNKPDLKGRTALLHASISGKTSIIRLLLKTPHVRRDVSDHLGRNALSYAAEAGHLRPVKELLRANLSITAQDHHGRNAISWAANSAKASERNEGRCSLELLVGKSPQDADVKDNDGWTPLAWAMEKPGYLNSVKILVEVGHVDVNQGDHSGRSVLAWAASEGFVEITEYLLQVPSVDKNLTSENGRSPLSYAAASGTVEVVERLLEDDDVIPDLADKRGRTPLDWAMLNHNEAVVQRLKDRLIQRL